MRFSFALVLAVSLSAARLPEGSVLEVRLSTPVSSRTTKAGTAVQGIVVVPVRSEAGTLVPVGSLVHGVVESVRRVGLGLVHETARLTLRFDSIELPQGDIHPIATRLLEVTNAREKVDKQGRVHGIRATDSISNRSFHRAVRLAMIHPAFGVPAVIVANVWLPFPEPEIEYPAGTEMRLALRGAIALAPQSTLAEDSMELSESQLRRLAPILEAMPYWVMSNKSKRPIDITNVLLAGSKDQVERALHAAGWTSAARNSPQTSFRAIRAFGSYRGYPDAPMRPLLLEGQPAQLKWQKSLNTFAKRHHVRIWQRPEKWQGRDLWLGAATHDIGYGLSYRPLTFTHKINEAVDGERNKLVHDLLLTGCVESFGLADRPGQMRFADARNRKRLRTDDSVGVVVLNDCTQPKPTVAEAVEFAKAHVVLRVLRRTILTARNEALRNNLPFKIYDFARFGWWAIGRGGKPQMETASFLSPASLAAKANGLHGREVGSID